MFELLNGWLIVLFWIIVFMALVTVCAVLMYLLGKTICLLIDEIQNQKDDAEGKSKIHEDGTTTFEYRTTSRGTVDEYRCSCCGCYIYFPAYDTYVSEKIDYDYCPYCGRPVVKSEGSTE